VRPAILIHMKNKFASYIIKMSVDILAICVSWQLAIRARVALNPLGGISFEPSRYDLWAPSLAAILVLWICLTAWLKLYADHWKSNFSSIVRRSSEAAILLGSITVIVTFFSRGNGIAISRTFVFILLPIGLLLFALARAATQIGSVQLDRVWPHRERIAIVGEQQAALTLLNSMQHGQSGLCICGLIIPGTADLRTGVKPASILGNLNRLAEHINRERLDRLILIERSIPDSELDQCRSVSRKMGIPVSCTVGYFPTLERAELTFRHGIPLVEVTPVSFTKSQEFTKRFLDIVLSVLLLIVLAPLMLVIAVLVKCTSKGPILYKSPRVGKGGRHFTFLKFRSMIVASEVARLTLKNEKGGHLFKVRNDPRVTPIGRFLRRYSLDELPQLVNVLLGEMSIVGPRPLPAQDMDPDGMSRHFPGWAEQRAKVRPGITGLWQVRGRSTLPFEDMINFDLEYIQNWSLSKDIRILLETPALVLSGSGAY
jgi:exopolysaccharide biosynthesis polyprenyl glycosylphosphotransferase